MTATGTRADAQRRKQAGVLGARASRGARHDVACAVQDIGKDRRYVIARLIWDGDASKGAGAGVTLQVIAHGSLAAGDEPGLMRDMAARKATLLVRLCPLDQAVARAIQVPSTGRGEAMAALALLAEGEAPAGVASHRVGAALLPARSVDPGAAGVAEHMVDALITAWVTPGPVHTGPHAHGARGRERPEGRSGVEVRWCTPLGAMAALRGAGAEPVVMLDRGAGAVAVLSTGGQKPVALVARDFPDDDVSWDAVVRRALDDALSIAQPADEDEAARLTAQARGEGLPDAWSERTSRRVQGMTLDRLRLEQFGACIGALLAAGDDRPGGLASLTEHPPRERVGALTRAGRWLSVPSRALVVGALAMLAMAMLPWATAAARAAIVKDKAALVRENQGGTKETALRAAMYRQLERARLPMTKLLADLSGAAPVGLVVDDARITVENQRVALGGVADSNDVLTTFQARLNQTGLFSQVKLDNTRPKDGGGVEFDMTLEVAMASVHRAVTPAETFAEQTLAVRMHGAGALNTTPPRGSTLTQTRSGRAVASDGSASAGTPSGASPAPSVGNRPGRERPAAGAASATTRRPDDAAASTDPPPELSDEEIKKLNATDAMKAWVERRRFLQANQKADPAVRTKVEDQATKLRARMDEARKEEGKAGGGGA